MDPVNAGEGEGSVVWGPWGPSSCIDCNRTGPGPQGGETNERGREFVGTKGGVERFEGRGEFAKRGERNPFQTARSCQQVVTQVTRRC